MRNYSFLILVFSLLLQTVAPAQRSAMNRINKKSDGLYIFNDQLKEIFPSAEVDYVERDIKTSLKNEDFYNTTYLVIVRNFLPSYEDLTSLKNFAVNGNNVMIFATAFNQEASTFFDFETDITYYDSNYIRFAPGRLSGMDTFKSKYLRNIENSFITFNKRNTTILGQNMDGSPNFIKIKYGTGNIFIHLYPDILSNGFIVEKNRVNYHYTEAVLSFLPRYVKNIIIKLPKRSGGDSYEGSSGGGGKEVTFMSFVLEQPNLKAALVVGLLIFGLLVLFGIKTLQRRIPVVAPIENRTFEFAKTMGDLYFSHKNNADIAHKKIQYWQEYIRNKYQIPTHTMDKEFWEKVTKKSGVQSGLLNQLERNIIEVNASPKVSDKLLIQLSNNIDQFYKA